MKRSQQKVPGALTGALPTDDGFHSNVHTTGMTVATKGGRNATTEEAHRGAGQVAPRPKTPKQPYLSSSSVSAAVGASMARVPNAGATASGGIPNPVRKPNSGLRRQAVGQPNPNTSAASTAKPKRRGLGAAFYGEY